METNKKKKSLFKSIIKNLIVAIGIVLLIFIIWSLNSLKTNRQPNKTKARYTEYWMMKRVTKLLIQRFLEIPQDQNQLLYSFMADLGATFILQ